MEQTVIIIKPDGMKRGLIGEIVHRFERVGLRLVAAKLVKPDKSLFEKHYNSTDPARIKLWGEKTLKTYTEFGKNAKKDFGTDDPMELGKLVKGWLMDYVTQAPVLVMLWEGKHAVQNAMNLAGPTMPVNAPAGTIRGDFSTDSAAYANAEKRGVENLIHVSTSVEEANFEKSVWFKPQEIFEY
jgi:nucleoside-diphosphate kinase